ncbi:TRAP transporter small permease [Thorsellia kenyensis]|uniref:TRAP transporter small permease protein n=1 Tax=Thorsellia kenyensis TaxID=1549888 RepID=A0ABV6CE37_9GAMM
MLLKTANILGKINHPVAKFFAQLSGVLLLAMTVIVICQIGFRYILNMPLDWTDEVSRFLMIYMTYLCLPMVYLANQNIAMTLFTDLIKGTRLHVLLMFLTHIIAIITFSVWIYFGYQHFLKGNVTADSLPIKMFWLYGIAPIFFGLTCFAALEKLLICLHLLFSDKQTIQKHYESETVDIIEKSTD